MRESGWWFIVDDCGMEYTCVLYDDDPVMTHPDNTTAAAWETMTRC